MLPNGAALILNDDGHKKNLGIVPSIRYDIC